MVRSLCLWFCLSVRYRNHFPVVQFQNQAHIWNPHGTGQVFKTIWGFIFFFIAPNFLFFYRRRRWRKLPPQVGHPKFSSCTSFTAAEGGGFPIVVAKGATPPEREGNPTEGGYFANSIILKEFSSVHQFLSIIYHRHGRVGAKIYNNQKCFKCSVGWICNHLWMFES